MGNALDNTDLKVICDLVHSLTILRLQHCEHLAIENYAPELFGKLLCEYEHSRQPDTINQIIHVNEP